MNLIDESCLIIGVIPLYRTDENAIKGVFDNAKRVDYCILIDDSEKSLYSRLEKRLGRFESQIEYIWNGNNIGLCRTVNIAIKRAIEMGAKWILFMDQDSRMQNNIVSIYRDFITKNTIDRVALLAPQYNYDRHRRLPKNGHVFIKRANLSGSLINVDVLSEIGLFDERFYIDGLDHEWCLRALKKGYRLIRCSEAVIKHHPAHTRVWTIRGVNVFKYGWDKPDRYYYQFRSMRLIHSLYHDPFNIFMYLYKCFKIAVIFDDKRAYQRAWYEARKDYNNSYYGTLRDGQLRDSIGLSK